MEDSRSINIELLTGLTNSRTVLASITVHTRAAARLTLYEFFINLLAHPYGFPTKLVVSAKADQGERTNQANQS